MNYIKELNAFNDWLETNQPSQQEILLWFALMQVCNRTVWKEEFSVAVSVLSNKTGGMSASAIERARAGLTKLGRITWRPQGGGRASLYSIIPFVHLTEACDEGINKQNQIKQNETKERKRKATAQPSCPSVAKQVVEYLNQVRGTQYNPLNKSTIAKINGWVKEGHSLEDFITVVDKKVAEWGTDPKMMGYLRPETLFGSKFEGYLNQPWGAGKVLSQTDQTILGMMARGEIVEMPSEVALIGVKEENRW